MRPDPELPLVFSRDEALRAGASRHQIAHRVRTGAWRPLRRGIYTQESRYSALTARERHTLGVVGALMLRGGDHVASHLSAAVAYGWVLPLAGPGSPTLTNADVEGTTRREPGLVEQVATVPAGHRGTRRVRIGADSWQIPITSPARTVADNLRHLPNADGVALADSTLRSEQVQYDQVAACLDTQALWPYAENGRRGLALVDPRRETWLESFSFTTLHSLGLAMPEPQVVIHDERGRLIARVDGWLGHEAVALEADGREKYFLDGGGRAPARDLDLAADDLRERVRQRLKKEKARQDRLGDVGAQVARWGTYDIVHQPREVLRRVDAARRRGDASRFTGRTSYQPPPAWLAPPVQPYPVQTAFRPEIESRTGLSRAKQSEPGKAV